MSRFLTLCFLTLSLTAQTNPPMSATTGSLEERITKEIQASPEMMANLTFLTDDIGPRPTGSAVLAKAHDFLEARAKGYGLKVLPRESWSCGSTWLPGEAKARLLTQNGQNLAVAQVGWTPGTPGALKAEVVHIAGTPDEALLIAQNLKGRIAFLDEVRGGEGDPAERRAKMQKLYALVKAQPPAALLLSARRTEQRLTTHGGPRIAPFFPTIPIGYLADDHALLLRRLLKRGEPVRMELTLGGTLSEAPGTAWNTVIDLPGRTKPEEVVLLTAHVDSWHLGQGAVDNGAGTVAILEALRALKAAGLQPARTIRVAILDGEEIGLLGAKAYAEAHKAEMPGHQAAFNMDIGAGRISSFALQGREDVKAGTVARLASPPPLGVKEPTLIASQDSDHAPLAAQGVPTFNTIQDGLEAYLTTYHAATDTLERVKAEDLKQCATVLALAALELANQESRLPQRVAAPVVH